MTWKSGWILLISLLTMGLRSDSTPYSLLELRFFEGFREQQETISFWARPLALDPEIAQIRENEERSLTDIFQLSRINYLSSIELWLPERARQAQSMPVTVHNNLLNLNFEPQSGQKDRFRLVVTMRSPQTMVHETLLDTLVILPQQKRAVLGFRDKQNRLYFISLGRNQNVKLGSDRLIGNKSVRDPRLVKHVSPDYPLSALKQGLEGMVVVEGTTDSRGDTVTVNALTGPESLTQAVIHAVKQWIYRPFNVDGTNESTRFVVACFFYIQRPDQKPLTPESLHGRFDAFWQTHEKSPWPDPGINGMVSKGINQRLIEFVIIEGRRELESPKEQIQMK